MPKISIIIPCYNQENYISECLDSVLAQTFDDFETIVVNDGSKDKSLDIIKEYASKHPNKIRYIDQQNQGVVVARNNAIKQAKGKYIFPLDGDDKIASDCLEKLYNIISTTNYRVVGSETRVFGKDSGHFWQPKFTKYEMYGCHECCVISALFYKEDFEKFGGYKEAFNGYGGDDMDYWLNYIDHGYPMLRLPEALFFYRVKEDSESVWKNYPDREMQNRTKYKNEQLIKYHPKMRIWSILYQITHSKIARFFYQKKIKKSGRLYIKICKIPLPQKIIQLFNKETYHG